MSSEEKVLLLSPDGMLGRAFQRLFDSQNLNYSTALYPNIDLRERTSVEKHVKETHSLVINCSAYTDVDGAESNEDEAMTINGEGVGLLGKRCHDVGAQLVHFSTDYVFDGSAAEPYRTEHQRQPVNAYGRTKARGEELLEESGCHSLLVRTSWLYAPWGKNFVRTIAELASERDELKVVNDQRGRPTSAEHLARTTMELLAKGAEGIFHVTDGGHCTWYELAAFIAARVNPQCEVKPCSSEEFPRPAPRPSYSVLDLSKTVQLLGTPLPDWQEHVWSLLSRIEAE